MRKKIRIEKVRKMAARRERVRKQMRRSDRIWLTVYRSSKHIYAQLVDPASGRTLATVSTRSGSVMGGSATTGNVEAAKKVGTAVTAVAKEKKTENCCLSGDDCCRCLRKREHGSRCPVSLKSQLS